MDQQLSFSMAINFITQNQERSFMKKHLSVSSLGTRAWTTVGGDGYEFIHRQDGPALYLNPGFGLPLVKRWVKNGKQVDENQKNN